MHYLNTPQNWHNLRLAASGEQVKNAPAVNKQPYGRKKKIKIPNKVIFIKYVLIVVPVLFSISILHSTFRSKETDFKINVRNPIDTIPFTAVFDYHIPVNARDTFYLNIPESGSVRFPLVPGTNIFTHWFRNAGFYHVTLQNKSRILDTLYVYALSKNWQSGITRHPDILLFKPLSLNKNCKSLDSLLYTSPYQLYKLGIDTLSNYFMEFRLFKSFDVPWMIVRYPLLQEITIRQVENHVMILILIWLEIKDTYGQYSLMRNVSDLITLS